MAIFKKTLLAVLLTILWSSPVFAQTTCTEVKQLMGYDDWSTGPNAIDMVKERKALAEDLAAKGINMNVDNIPIGIGKDYCIVTTDRDYKPGGDFMVGNCFVPLRYALDLADLSNMNRAIKPTPYWACRKGIRVETQNVFLQAPITVKPTDKGENGFFKFHGTEKIHTLSASQAGLQKNGCLVTVDGSVAPVQMWRFDIVGTGKGSGNAVCIKSGQNVIRYLNIKSFGTGINISSGASGTEIAALNVIDSTTAVVDNNTEPTAFNIFKFARDLGDTLDYKWGLIGNKANGIVDIPSGFIDATTKKIKSSIYEHLIRVSNVDTPPFISTQNRTIKIVDKNKTDKGTIIEGALYNAGDTNCSDGNRVGGLERLAIFSVKPPSQGGTYYGFIGFVGKKSPTYGVDTTNNGIGNFKFIINDKDPNSLLYGASQIVLVPLKANGELLGRASRLIDLNDVESEVDCDGGSSGDDDQQGGGGDSLDTEEIDRLLQFTSVQACFMSGDYSEDIDMQEDYDTDGDNIPDWVESRIVYDKDRNVVVGKPTCDCKQTVTCWYNADTDYDGIIDSKDNYGSLSDYRAILEEVKAGTKPLGTPVPLPNSDSGIYKTKGGETITLKYGDKDPDANDRDSDNDGWKDGFEDRQKIFDSTAKAYLFNVDSYGGIYFNPDGTQNPVSCTLVTEDEKTMGVKYLYYAVRKGKDGKFEIEEVSKNTKKAGITGVYFLACKNTYLDEGTNFNGQLNADKGESDPRDFDTDGDCVCDGDGDGCMNIDEITNASLGKSCKGLGKIRDDNSRTMDGCPNTNYASNECVDCLNAEVMWSVCKARPDFFEGIKTVEDCKKRSALKLKMGVKNRNRALIFEKMVKDPDRPNIMIPDYETIKRVSPDLDKDLIPDIVENPTIECKVSDNSRTALSPLRKDTDGDGVPDREDVCPFTKGTPRTQGTPGQDDFDPKDPNKVYSCTKETDVYGQDASNMVTDKIFACYRDIDKDGLVDCREDLNIDGKLDIVEGIAGIQTSESNPYLADTDGDTISDFLEVKGWPTIKTNPGDSDTDRDGLLDGEEDGNGDKKITLTYSNQQRGCPVNLNALGFASVDSDPTKEDTDGDKIKDKDEVMPNTNIGTYSFVDALLKNKELLKNGYHFMTDPDNKDSDNDGLDDGVELMEASPTVFNLGTADSNPCSDDTDDDKTYDAMEKIGCAQNPSLTCQGGSRASGADQDQDGLEDAYEIIIGTNPKEPDTDGDGLKDGEEVRSRMGKLDLTKGGDTDPRCGDLYTDADLTDCQTMTNKCRPDCMVLIQFWSEYKGRCKLGYDTDHDGLRDKVDADPWTADRDGDGLLDGLEDRDHDGVFKPNAIDFSDPDVMDTDGDGIPDGWRADRGGEDKVPTEFEVKNGGQYCDVNGILDFDQDNRLIQLNPQLQDSNGDGTPDGEQMKGSNGLFDINNLGSAVSGRQGCSLTPNADGSPISNIGLLGLVLTAALFAVKRRYAQSVTERVQEGLVRKETSSS